MIGRLEVWPRFSQPITREAKSREHRDWPLQPVGYSSFGGVTLRQVNTTGVKLHNPAPPGLRIYVLTRVHVVKFLIG